MPRLVIEQWENIQHGVEKGQAQRANPDGTPMADPDGNPIFVDIWTLVLIRDSPEGRHILKVPFEKANKDQLIASFSDGIVIAQPGTLPPHLPFGRGV